MKSVLFSTLLSAAIIITTASNAFALEDSPKNRAIQAERYLTVNSPQDIFRDIAERTKDSLPTDEQQTFIDLLTKYLDLDVLEQAMKASLMSHFTAEELFALANFYSMPGSKSAMNKMGIYMSDVIPVVHDEMIKAQERAFEAQQKKLQTLNGSDTEL